MPGALSQKAMNLTPTLDLATSLSGQETDLVSIYCVDFKDGLGLTKLTELDFQCVNWLLHIDRHNYHNDPNIHTGRWPYRSWHRGGEIKYASWLHINANLPLLGNPKNFSFDKAAARSQVPWVRKQKLWKEEPGREAQQQH